MGTKYYYLSVDSSFTSYISNDSAFDSLNPNSLDQSNHLAVSVAIWIILLITILFGTTGNILVLYVYINRKDNKTCTFFIKMLAVVDLIICLILAPLELYHVTTGMWKFYSTDLCNYKIQIREDFLLGGKKHGIVIFIIKFFFC